jgi:hypothetical protein
MVSVLDSYLSLVEHDPGFGEVESAFDRRKSVEEMLAVHTALFLVMERRLGEEGIKEEHRSLVPLFQRWLAVARRITPAVWELKRAGIKVAGLDEFMFSINRSKWMAEEFDFWIKRNQEIARGELGKTIPLTELMNELRNRAE